METQIHKSIILSLRNRQTCLFLSDFNNSFKWSFFSFYILPQLKRNQNESVKGAFVRNRLNIIVPVSSLPKSENVCCVHFSHKQLCEYNIFCRCSMYFVNTNYLQLDSLCFAVYVGEDAVEIFDDIRSSSLFSLRSLAFVNDAFQCNGAKFLSIIEKTIHRKPKFNIGNCIVNLLGAQVGADSIDTPEQAIRDSSKTKVHKLGLNTIEVDYNYGISLSQVASLFTLNSAYIPLQREEISRRIIDLRDDKAEYLRFQLDLELLVSNERNTKDLLKSLEKAISALELTNIINIVDPDFSEWFERTSLDIIKNQLVERIQLKCDNILKQFNQ